MEVECFAVGWQLKLPVRIVRIVEFYPKIAFALNVVTVVGNYCSYGSIRAITNNNNYFNYFLNDIVFINLYR